MRKTQDIRIAAILGIVGVLAGLSLAPNLLGSMDKLPAELPIPQFPLVLTIISLQLGLITFLAGWIGITLARRSHLQLSILDAFILRVGRVRWDAKWLAISMLCGGLAGLLIIGSDKFVFSGMSQIIKDQPPESSLSSLIVGVLYGGIVEEVLLRLFLMSLLVCLLGKMFVRDDKIPSWIYIISILMTATIFVLGHLPATSVLFGELTPMLIMRSFLLNGLAGIAFGYLFWKKGIEYSIVSHITAHVSMQILFIPLLYGG